MRQITARKPDCQTILASQYQLYLPTAEQLVHEIDAVKRRATQNGEEP